MAGFFSGIVVVILAFAFLKPEISKLNNFSLAHNIAHYDSKTGEYVQDSLFLKNDSTIIIIRSK